MTVNEYTMTDINDIQREANARIIKETSEWFPDQNVKYFLVSTAQVRHVLEAINILERQGE